MSFTLWQHFGRLSLKFWSFEAPIPRVLMSASFKNNRQLSVDRRSRPPGAISGWSRNCPPPPPSSHRRQGIVLFFLNTSSPASPQLVPIRCPAENNLRLTVGRFIRSLFNRSTPRGEDGRMDVQLRNPSFSSFFPRLSPVG